MVKSRDTKSTNSSSVWPGAILMFMSSVQPSGTATSGSSSNTLQQANITPPALMLSLCQRRFIDQQPLLQKAPQGMTCRQNAQDVTPPVSFGAAEEVPT
jgi:hypothetical protein